MATSGLLLRPAQNGETRVVWELIDASYREFGNHMPPENWAQMRTNLQRLVEGADPSNVTLAELDGTPVGTVSYFAPGEPPGKPGSKGFTRFPADWAVLRLLAVSPSFRQQGIGRRLTSHCIERARADGTAVLGLITSELMVAAKKVYRDLGFELQEEFVHLGLRFGLYALRLSPGPGPGPEPEGA